MRKIFPALLLVSFFIACKNESQYDTIIRNGLVCDGNGGKPYRADIGIIADTIAFIGSLANAKADAIVDADNMAVAPGFINMLSWANELLIEDGRSQGDIRQGVTLEVMGEGWSMGPLNERLKQQLIKGQDHISYDVKWSTLGEYLQFLENKGVSCNVASFIGASTVREYVIGEDDREPTTAELDSMCALVEQAMQEGAMGVGSSLIYPPAFFAKTPELVALCKTASKYGGTYISHMRSEGNQLMEALEELITIAKEANIHAEVYHLKAAGKNNWHKMDSAIARIEKARADGLNISADMYTYVAGATGLTACFPPSLQDGGFGKLWLRLQDKKVRNDMIKAMHTNATEWENMYYASGGPDNILLLGFQQDSLRRYNGKTLGEAATMYGKSPEETAMDLIVHDSTRVSVAFFLMSEENLKKQIVLPWMSFGSDAGSYTNEGIFLRSGTHPRAYGNFARVLGKYVREEKLLPLETAVYKLSKLPATNLKLQKRGELKVGYYADIVIFDPATVADKATFDNPHQYSIGVFYVWVNGKMVLKDGNHTGALPGRFVKGPGFKHAE